MLIYPGTHQCSGQGELVAVVSVLRVVVPQSTGRGPVPRGAQVADEGGNREPDSCSRRVCVRDTPNARIHEMMGG
jgi:hypothetical protein